LLIGSGGMGIFKIVVFTSVVHIFLLKNVFSNGNTNKPKNGFKQILCVIFCRSGFGSSGALEKDVLYFKKERNKQTNKEIKKIKN
jgi:hypothetical protein